MPHINYSPPPRMLGCAVHRVGQRANYAPYPRPVSAAILVSSDNQILGTGITTCNVDAIYDCLINSGLEGITPLHHEWFVSWPSNAETRRNMEGSTLYVTLEPSAERKG
jgi:pyrimidine deaminase RibD-like protein